MSDSLWPHGLQHARPPCQSPTPGVYSNSGPSRWWCPPTISSPSPSISPSIRVFSSESVLRIRWPKDCSFSFNISPSNEHPGLDSTCMCKCMTLIFLSDLLHSGWQSLSPSTSLQMTQFCSFLCMSSIPFYAWPTHSISIPLWMDTQIASMSWLLQIVL